MPPEPRSRPAAVVIYNPISGGSRGEEVSRRTEVRLVDAGYEVERLATRDRRGAIPVAAEVAARDEPVERLVVVGGDGTVRETIDGLGDARARIPIGIVPMGNANVVARELGIGKDIDDAITVAVTGRPVDMDLGTVRGDDFEEVFLAVVGVGWDAHTVRLLDRFRHTALGRGAYRVWADGLYGISGFAAALRPRQERFGVEVDGASLGDRYCAAWVCNLRTYGKGMAVTPDAHRSTGRLHIQARKRAAAPFLLWQLGSALRGTETPGFIADYADGTVVRLTSERPVAVEVEGDDRGWTTTLTLTVQPAAIRIFAP